MRIPSVSLYLYTHPPRFRIGFFIAQHSIARHRDPREKRKGLKEKKRGERKEGKRKEEEKEESDKKRDVENVNRNDVTRVIDLPLC